MKLPNPLYAIRSITVALLLLSFATRARSARDHLRVIKNDVSASSSFSV